MVTFSRNYSKASGENLGNQCPKKVDEHGPGLIIILFAFFERSFRRSSLFNVRTLFTDQIAEPMISLLAG